ncbi:tRNA lysidine(34) synthetase TilS [Helicobacter sp. 13S00477-4]|uniref:tRNA lysidine(34) synthetase TilS n=1 Tax=Helicobacter sp. 13S00477-4 TaxID=1905759 RepID=UPI000BA535F6|nr:tRNA lysidine(34) synthetase TilS [Helicobacter sp. 13S00477-4]PAF52303.1 tRNA lysidine(34) synthetase TilS [Helicobacter sp. 13S00477-4]
MLKLKFIDKIQNTKNLLGFSGGVDSVSLFFALLKSNICFDIAIVDYQIRDSSKDEVAYAQSLAKFYKKKCFVWQSNKIDGDFERKAREIRYAFFENLIKEYGYEYLLLAHHLNDRLEWFLMQLSKGCGLNTLLGFEGIEDRGSYQIIRPLMNVSKNEIYEYGCSYKFYEDISNQDSIYKRNAFRLSYSNDLIEKYGNGILKSFEYLRVEKSLLYKKEEILFWAGIYYFKCDSDITNLYWVDKILKKMGYVLSAKQREEILKTNFSLGIGEKYIIQNNQMWIFVCREMINPPILPKRFKNITRENKIPKRIRPQIYLYFHDNGIEFKEMQTCLKKKFAEYQ